MLESDLVKGRRVGHAHRFVESYAWVIGQGDAGDERAESALLEPGEERFVQFPSDTATLHALLDIHAHFRRPLVRGARLPWPPLGVPGDLPVNDGAEKPIAFAHRDEIAPRFVKRVRLDTKVGNAFHDLAVDDRENRFEVTVDGRSDVHDAIVASRSADFHSHRDRVAATETQCDHAALAARSPELVDQGGQHSGS